MAKKLLYLPSNIVFVELIMKNQNNKILFGQCVKTNLAEFDLRHYDYKGMFRSGSSHLPIVEVIFAAYI